ncbi:hypothetical protein VNO78_24445 [Psophocarpus tetragonolobus]|uniref:SMC hinge domain-containing protein n=1 Tax=Psophocarpus tetragonolobus TaxID=3891 RepID=A0AAN9S4F8_PSOTE
MPLAEGETSIVDAADARAKVSETSAKKYNDVLDAHEKPKDLENTLKDEMKELQNFNKEKEEDVARQLEIPEKESQDSTAELGKIISLHEEQVKKEKDKTLSSAQLGLAFAFQKLLVKAKEQKLLDEIDRLKEELHDCDENTKTSLWGKENELTAEMHKLGAEVEKTEKSPDHAIHGDVRRGLNSVRKICRQYNISGVHGPIIELLNCDEKFFTAVEVTAGNRFHALHIQSSDVIPLLKKLNFKPDYTRAFSQVFARTVICKNLDVASRVARTDGVDCTTLEKVRFNLQDILSIDQKINELVAEQQKIDAKRAHDKSEMDQLKQDIANANKQKLLISKSLTKKEKSVGDVQNEIEPDCNEWALI